jgi:hypothetical protein
LVDSAAAGLNEEKRLSGERPLPDSDRNGKRFYKNPVKVVKPKKPNEFSWCLPNYLGFAVGEVQFLRKKSNVSIYLITGHPAR